jgi:hypothetical protein
VDGYFEQPGKSENIRTLTITNRGPALLGFFRDAIDLYGLVVAKTTRHVPYGDASLLQTHVPVVKLHRDTGLERTARAFAYILDKVDATPRADLERGAIMPSAR